MSVVGGKLVVEPVDVPAELSTKIRRAGGSYLADKRKLRLPLKYFGADGATAARDRTTRRSSRVSVGAGKIGATRRAGAVAKASKASVPADAKENATATPKDAKENRRGLLAHPSRAYVCEIRLP